MPLWRSLLATLGTLTAAAWLAVAPNHWPVVLWLPTSLLVAGALLLQLDRFGAQVLIRAVWWQGLVLGTLVTTDGSASERLPGALLALGSGAALLALGRLGLDRPGRFNPLAYRGLLIASIAMALADAQVLLLWGGVNLEQVADGASWHHQTYPLLLGCAAVMLVAVVGLLRLKVWGVLLTLLANLGIAALALGGALRIPSAAAWALVATAAAQLLLPIPLLVAFVRRTAPRSAGISTRGALLTGLVVAGLMLWCSAMLLLR